MKSKSCHDVAATGADTIVVAFEATIEEGEDEFLVSQMCRLLCPYLMYAYTV